jgi:hypothetical protein
LGINDLQSVVTPLQWGKQAKLGHGHERNLAATICSGVMN